MLRGHRILLTGGGGFIGSALARRLAGENRVRVFDNGYRRSLDASGLSEQPSVELIQGDVLDGAAVRAAVDGCDLVVHLASIAGVDTVRRMPVKTMRVSLVGTMNVLDACVAAGGVKRFIDFSTSEVFGTFAYKVGEGDVTTLGAVGEARWTYAVSKLATEHLTYQYLVEHGLPTLSIRPFNIYGPGQIGEGAIHRFCVRALKGEALEIHNDGAQIRAWCYVDDMVDAVASALELPEAVGHAFNIGNPRSVSTTYELAKTVVRLSGGKSDIRFKDWPFKDIDLRVPDISKARRILGFDPKVELEEGLARTLAWFRSFPDERPV